MMLCPCQSQKPYANCCEPFITGTARPQTPEQLMRSRYTAYTQANMDYIVATMQGKPLEGYDKESSKLWAQSVKWLGLEVVDAPKAQAKKGFVEFIASYEENGRVKKMHERSEFARIGGGTRWFYVSGQTPTVERNAACPCGSGKKYKKCCGFKG
jgi:SEC-C motif-containing protein